MQPRFKAPPYQPKWLLQLQVFLLRHRLMGPLNRQYMIITTIGRKTGRKHSTPIGFVPDGDTYLALNMGGRSNWYLNARANPQVTLEVNGQKIEARAEDAPIKTPEQLKQVLDAYKRERPGMIEGIFSISADTPQDELMKIGEFTSFMRFRRVA
jgi:deazaflavin-dependent oxidoreductase (nitroreductase family)